MTKTCVIYHSRDLDGWMSAAIVKKWWNEITHLSNYDELVMLGWDYGNEVPDVSMYDKVIMCDVSFPPEKMLELYIDRGSNFIFIDHHKSAIESVEEKIGLLPDGLQDSKFSACELAWKYFFPSTEMPELVRLLGRYDCFGHKGTDEETKVLEFQYGARQIISNYEEAYELLVQRDDESIVYDIHSKGISIYEYLCTEAQQIYNKAFDIKLDEPDVFRFEIGSTNTLIRNFLCVNQERFNPVNFGIDYHADGYEGFACFWYKDGKWMFSLYNDDEQVDCSAIAKQYGGGGHKGAAGFVTDNIEIFLKNHKI